MNAADTILKGKSHIEYMRKVTDPRVIIVTKQI